MTVKRKVTQKRPKRPVRRCACPRSDAGEWLKDEHGAFIVDPYCPIHGEWARREFEQATKYEESEK